MFKPSFNSNISFDKELSRMVEDSLYIDTYHFRTSASFSEAGIGYHYLLLNNLCITLEFHKKYSIDIPIQYSIFNILPPDEQSIHLGGYFRYNNPHISYWNNLNFRSGIYIKELNFSNKKLADQGFTIGIGIEYLNQMNTLDFSLSVGKKDSHFFNGNIENYIRFQIGISTGEKWFLKKRRK